MKVLRAFFYGLVMSLCSINHILVAKQGSAIAGKEVGNTLYVTCGDDSSHSRSEKSAILVSPDAKYRAYVTVNTTSSNSFPKCTNISRLFVSGEKGKGFKVTFEEIPPVGSTTTGNGLSIVDWSPRRHFLAMELLVWTYGSDVGGTVPVIYSADNHRVIKLDLVEVFSRVLKKSCPVRLREIVGFTADDMLVVEVGNAIDLESPEELDQYETKCFGEADEFWIVDVEKNEASRLSSRPTLVQYGLPGTADPTPNN